MPIKLGVKQEELKPELLIIFNLIPKEFIFERFTAVIREKSEERLNFEDANLFPWDKKEFLFSFLKGKGIYLGSKGPDHFTISKNPKGVTKSNVLSCGENPIAIIKPSINIPKNMLDAFYAMIEDLLREQNPDNFPDIINKHKEISESDSEYTLAKVHLKSLISELSTPDEEIQLAKENKKIAKNKLNEILKDPLDSLMGLIVECIDSTRNPSSGVEVNKAVPFYKMPRNEKLLQILGNVLFNAPIVPNVYLVKLPGQNYVSTVHEYIPL